MIYTCEFPYFLPLYSIPSQKSPTHSLEPSRPASSKVEELSLPSRSTQNHEEATRPDSNETCTDAPTEAISPSTILNSNLNSTININDNQDPTEQLLSQSREETKDDSNESAPTDESLEAALQEAVRAEADSHLQGGGDGMNIEVSYAPDPTQLAPELPPDPVEEENRSPEYSPTLHRTAPDVPDRESDDYEPPDATAPSDVLESPPFSPAPPESIHELADDSMQDVNPIQAIDEDGQNTEETQPLHHGSSQQLLEVKSIFTTFVRSGFADNRLE
jgi:hypothetical protein